MIIQFIKVILLQLGVGRFKCFTCVPTYRDSIRKYLNGFL